MELADELSWRSLRFWSTLIAVDAGAGLAGGVLMRLLHSVEHWAWQYHAGDLLRGIDQTTPTHRVAMLLFAGVIVAITGPMINRFLAPGNINAARIPAVATLVQSVQSIVIMRPRTSLGSPHAQRRMLVACGPVKRCRRIEDPSGRNQCLAYSRS